MNIKELKNIMKQVNEPNEYLLDAYDLLHPHYWIFKIENVRVKTLYTELQKYRKDEARFDVFINGLFISNDDYIYENIGNTFFIKFIRERFPEFDRFGNPYILEPLDEVKINGDIEIYK